MTDRTLRLSTDPTDPAYCEAAARNGGVRVFVDGVEVAHPVSADEAAGEAVAFDRGEDGNFVMDGDQVARKTVSGVVQIVLPSELAHLREELGDPPA